MSFVFCQRLGKGKQFHCFLCFHLHHWTHITLMKNVHMHSFRASGEFWDKIIKIGVRKECSWYELTKALHHEGYTEASGKTTLRLSIFVPPSQCSQKLGSDEWSLIRNSFRIQKWNPWFLYIWLALFSKVTITYR